MVGVVGVVGRSRVVGVVRVVGWSVCPFGSRFFVAAAQVAVLVGTVRAVDHTVALEVVVYAGTVSATKDVLGTAFGDK